jgi:hypothetical protein
MSAPVVLYEADWNAWEKRPITSSITAATKMKEVSGDVIFSASINMFSVRGPRKHALLQGTSQQVQAPRAR